jgi:hypothetical protein
MVKKYTALVHDTSELLDSNRDDKHVLVLYQDYKALEIMVDRLEHERTIWVNGNGVGAEYLKAQARIRELEAALKLAQFEILVARNVVSGFLTSDALEDARNFLERPYVSMTPEESAAVLSSTLETK